MADKNEFAQTREMLRDFFESTLKKCLNEDDESTLMTSAGYIASNFLTIFVTTHIDRYCDSNPNSEDAVELRNKLIDFIIETTLDDVKQYYELLEKNKKMLEECKYETF